MDEEGLKIKIQVKGRRMDLHIVTNSENGDVYRIVIISERCLSGLVDDVTTDDTRHLIILGTESEREKEKTSPTNSRRCDWTRWNVFIRVNAVSSYVLARPH